MSKTVDSYTLSSLFKNWGPNDPIQRWLDEGTIVIFKPYRVGFENTEFTINNRDNWRIWYSQLNEPLYNGDLDNLQVCSFKMKSGDYIFPAQITHDKFWKIVKDKRFRVAHALPCYRPNPENAEVRIMTFGQVYEKVHKAILNGNGESVKDMLKPQSCYDLEEI